MQRGTGADRPYAAGVLTGLLCAVLAGAVAAAEPAAITIQRGVAYASWWAGEYQEPYSDLSLERLASTGADWVDVVVTCYQADADSMDIAPDPQRTPTDADLAHVIATARSLGLNVMLKPMVDLQDGTWRGFIGQDFDADAWAAWFASYELFIGHYAHLASDHGVNLLCVGTELVTATVGPDRTAQQAAEREGDWRAVIALVRGLYAGPLTYAANHGGEESLIPWWDALDLIGVDAYYGLVRTANKTPTLAQLLNGWAAPVATLSALATAWDKPVLLTEIGYRSVDGTCAQPWLWGTGDPPDRDEQALAYEAAFLTLLGKPWFAGMYWWNWRPDPLLGSSYDDTDYTPHHKPAEAVLRAYYGGPAAPMLCVEAIGPDALPRPGVPITCGLWGNEYHPATHFSLVLDAGSSATLAAPRSFDGEYFLRWQDAAGAPVRYTTELPVTMDAGKTVVAAFTTAQPSDIDGNGCVNVSDLVQVRTNLGNQGDSIQPPTADVDRNGIVNVSDFIAVRTTLGEGCL